MGYSLLYSLPQPLRDASIPVSVESGALFRDENTHYLAAQFRLKNCAGIPVAEALIGITLFGANGERLAAVSYPYRAQATPGTEFGQFEAIALRDCPAVSFRVVLLRVSFTNGQVWDPYARPAAPEPRPVQIPVVQVPVQPEPPAAPEKPAVPEEPAPVVPEKPAAPVIPGEPDAIEEAAQPADSAPTLVYTPRQSAVPVQPVPEAPVQQSMPTVQPVPPAGSAPTEVLTPEQAPLREPQPAAQQIPQRPVQPQPVQQPVWPSQTSYRQPVQPWPAPQSAAPAQSLAGKGKRQWLPLLFFGLAIVMQFITNVAFRRAYLNLYDGNPISVLQAITDVLRYGYESVELLLWLLGLVLPILCLVLSKKGKGCKVLGIVSLAIVGIQIAVAVWYAVLWDNDLLNNLPQALYVLFWIPGAPLVMDCLYLVYESEFLVPNLLSVISDLLFISTNVVTGICFLKSARR